MSPSQRRRRVLEIGYAVVLSGLFALLAGGCSQGTNAILDPDTVDTTIHPSARGCSLTSEPQSGAVEYAAGLVALVASVLGLRRRLRRQQDDITSTDVHHRRRLPSMP